MTGMPTAQLVAFRRHARRLMDDFGFAHVPFKWDAHPTRAGQAVFHKNAATGHQWAPLRLVMSRTVAMAATWEGAEDTVRHEIAHLIAGQEANHGPAWRAACAITGAIPETYYKPDDHFAASVAQSVQGILASERI